ncbi:MAG: dihydrofolate reductase [Gammaproteobacteria bacterium]|nr:dihydrofolate reductase [Gammaproteobacteria bacterium]
MDISLIWAMSRNRVIGRGNTLPWRLPTEMRSFMATTMGKPVIMGRRTFESMKAPLPGRTNIVVTRDREYHRQGIKVAHDFEGALELARSQCRIDGVREIMVAGGADIYRLALPVATRLYMTVVDADIEGDTFFPEFDLGAWRQVRSETYAADGSNDYPFSISVLERPDSSP